MRPFADDAFHAGNSVLGRYLDALVAALSGIDAGEVATYIPQLGRADPSDFGIAIVTADGRLYRAGTWDRAVTIQSVSKPFMYGQALTELGRERVLASVGVEPTGERFNSIVLDEQHNRAFNPMVNSGAIVTASLLTRATAEAGAADMLDLFSRLAGRRLDIDAEVFRSEDETGHRNRAIAWLMLNSGMIEPEPDMVLDLYFRQCSVLVNCADLAAMACTLATLGRQPMTGDQVFSPEVTRDVLSVMTTCGMYDYAGQWLYDVGLPAKSGVSGMIMAVVPGQIGLAVYSPKLDAVGNSVRGIEVCRTFARDFGLHTCTSALDPAAAIRRIYGARDVHSLRQRTGAEREVLAAVGDAFAAIELTGPLYFAAAERVASEASRQARVAGTVVLDFRRVESIDAAALDLLSRIPGLLGSAGSRVLMTEIPDRLAARLGAALAAQGGEDALGTPTTEAALEAFEDGVLGAARVSGRADAMRLDQAELFSGLDPQDIVLLENAAASFSYAPGTHIITQGEAALAFYVVARGVVSITIPVAEGTRRISAVGPGQAFGELAMLDGGLRSANAVASGPVVCHAFAIDQIREIAERRPRAYATILGNLARSLSDRLRAANVQIGTFE
ncbi:glutaminase A [Salipiger mangrovisoli]|uniref:Glutaminase n=1 Tax=Salipiger mangrovisoli TaxID=2865933 RepID=A0ABR9X774_9RHOB|nr:glutaminase A [Salipiger mangrovisoli]MBE9639346.1 glutaminase A [Salipiger mangrovisoli]